MATSKDTKIEKTLRKVVLEAKRNGEDVSINAARGRTEEKLGLEAGFLKAGEWKGRSKAIIHAAFAEPNEDTDEPEERQAGSFAPDASKAAASTPKPPQKTAPQVNGVKRKTSEDGSAEGIKDKSAQRADQPLSKKAKVTASQGESRSEEASSISTSDESAEEQSKSGSGSSEAEDDELEEGPRQNGETSAEQQPLAQAVPAKSFKPPLGYSAVDSIMLSESNSLFNSDLQGKQIWHITAPSGIPLSSLTELTLSSISAAEPVLSYEDMPYVLNEDHTVGADSTALLVPSKGGYQKALPKVTRTLHLQQNIDLPSLSALQASQATGSHAAGDLAQAATTNVRPQPKGLRMRFKPPGFGRGNPGRIGSDSGSDDGYADEDIGPSFQFPRTLGQHGVEVRQDGDVEMVDAAEVEEPSTQADKREKKSKKKRKDEKSGAPNVEALKANGVVRVVSDDAAATHSKDETSPNGNGAREESKEDRKRRKEEKRARKEAKTKVKETAV